MPAVGESVRIDLCDGGRDLKRKQVFAAFKSLCTDLFNPFRKHDAVQVLTAGKGLGRDDLKAGIDLGTVEHHTGTERVSAKRFERGRQDQFLNRSASLKSGVSDIDQPAGKGDSGKGAAAAEGTGADNSDRIGHTNRFKIVAGIENRIINDGQIPRKRDADQ